MDWAAGVEVQTIYQLKDLHATLPAQVERALQENSMGEVLASLANFHRLVFSRVLEIADGHVQTQLYGLAKLKRYAFVMLGSGARQEQSIFGDQDHAFVYELDDLQGSSSEVDGWRVYLEELTKLTAGLLFEVGYPLCTGNVMASNARWRGTPDEWQNRLARYNDLPDWDHIRFLLIAADAKLITGHPDLVTQLRGQSVHYVARSPYMRWKIADQGMTAKVALTVLGGFRVESTGEHKGAIHIKDGLYTPLVNSIRLWAMSVGIEQPSTLERIRYLVMTKAWSDDLALGARTALETVLELRVRHHIALAVADQPINDYVLIDALTEQEKERLRKALRTTKQLQQITVRHFPKSG